MNKSFLIIGTILIVIVGGGFFLLQSKTQKAVAPTSTQLQNTPKPIEQTQATDSASREDLKEVTITGSNFKFDTNEIKVKKDQKVRVTFKSAGGTHNFVIDEFNVKTEILGSGKTQTIEFTPNKAGIFEYYCSIENHRKMGMVGKLIVE